MGYSIDFPQIFGFSKKFRILNFQNLSLLFYFLAAAVFVVGADVEKPPKLILISLDGLRYDFITPTRTPSLYLLAREGVFLERGLKVQVHTVTAPNHYSIVTGLYEESHGIIENDFWDPIRNETYDLWNFRSNQTTYERSKLAYWYEGTTPIWQTNEEEKYQNYDAKNRRRSGSYYWPMGDCFINNRTISRNLTWLDYGNEFIWRKEIDQLVGWLTDEKEAVNFLLYYNAQPDHVAHMGDVYGSNTASIVEGIDATMGYLIQRLRDVSLWDRVNLILTADHGHTNVPDKEHLILVGDYLNYSKLIVNGRSVFPKPDSGVTPEEIYENLTRAKNEKKMPLRIWRKEEFPDHYHYANNSRVGPVIVYEDLHYTMLFYGTPERFTAGKSIPWSTHGWLNDYAEMRSFFVAYGPAFKKGLRVGGRDDLENVDLYPLMCKILDIEPLPNNGSFERIKFILRDDSKSAVGGNLTNPYSVLLSTSNDYVGVAIAWAPMVILAFLVIVCVVVKFWQRRKKGIKENGNGSVGYRLLRNASPETHVDLTTTKTTPNTNSKTKNVDNGASAISGSDAFRRKPNGGQERFQRSAQSKLPIEDGRRQLVRLSDEEESSDENEL